MADGPTGCANGFEFVAAFGNLLFAVTDRAGLLDRRVFFAIATPQIIGIGEFDPD